MIKFIKFVVLLLTLSVVSKTALATSSIEWTYLNNLVATVSNYKETEMQLSLVNLKGETNMYIIHRKGSSSLDKYCSGSSATVTISVDSHLVNFYVENNEDYNLCMYKPVTGKGKEFLISYFKQKEGEYRDVSVEGNTFSTYGFGEVYDNISKGHLRKAL